MQSDIQSKLTIRRIATKEITLFFSSPIAYLFLATFSAVTLFVFFWGESFFARNIADVRPLFEWMPVLLIFLSSTLTMRLWSEERRSGTMEYVHTQAVPLWHFVTGKFIGCLVLLIVALLMTLPLPITVSIIGDMDWGPVCAGYVATLLMGAAYLSIGLFISARSDNQIVSLISACAVSGVFYLSGTSLITDFLGNQAGEWFRLLGTGSRFDSITRGVLDLRDLYYYISIILAFLALNTLALEKERWANDGLRSHHRQWMMVTALLVLNAVGANLWLGQLHNLRVDVTEGNQYSISEATQGYLNQLQEPLLIRGYFSGKTHPLLSPLVPQVRDLIREYEIAGKGRVRVEFIDPMSEPKLEEEANQSYGIQPVPFQVADRYQSSIVSSYFNVLVQYGNEHQVLGFRDLIEVQARGEGDIDVQLRNPEHDITRSIKRVLNTYQAGGNLFDTVKGNLVFNGYISGDDQLPGQLSSLKGDIQQVLSEFKEQASERFTFNVLDPAADNNKIANQIAQDFGFQPMATNIFSNEQFYFYMTLVNGEQIVQIPLGELTKDDFKRNLESSIKRFASGFTKTVALVAPQSEYSPYGPSGAQFSQLESFLGSELNVKREDLSDGSVSGDADILVLASPKDLDDKKLFAVDQFLMKGGTVMAATSPFSASLSNRSLNMKIHNSGLDEWLEHHGLGIEKKLVLDQQNAAFPVPVTRNLGGFQVQEIRMLDYPYFIDVRGEGLNQDNLITSELPQATLAWASPIALDKEKQGEREITELLSSSDSAWLSSSLDIVPSVSQAGLSTFEPEGERGAQLLGVISQGQFDSYYASKTSPLFEEEKEETDNETAVAETNDSDTESSDDSFQIASVIEKSSDSARIILFSSNDFLRDQIIPLAGSSQQSEYLNTLQMAVNAVDWSLEDSGLLSIRSRGHFNRTLPPMEKSRQKFWEYTNYGLSAVSLIFIALLVGWRRKKIQRHYLELLEN